MGNGRPVPAHYYDQYAGQLPTDLFYLWRRYGFGGFNDGWVWLTDPAHWQPMLDTWLTDVELPFDDDLTVVLRTALGELHCWGPRTGRSLTITPIHGLLNPNNQASRMLTHRGRMASSALGTEAGSVWGVNDDPDVPLFQRALAQHGPVTETTIYGFIPTLALGGDGTTTEIVDARVHLDLLHQPPPSPSPKTSAPSSTRSTPTPGMTHPESDWGFWKALSGRDGIAVPSC
ncbi:GAD-like domain-containing protein [Mariniluteicoccus flavus]